MVSGVGMALGRGSWGLSRWVVLVIDCLRDNVTHLRGSATHRVGASSFFPFFSFFWVLAFMLSV